MALHDQGKLFHHSAARPGVVGTGLAGCTQCLGIDVAAEGKDRHVAGVGAEFAAEDGVGPVSLSGQVEQCQHRVVGVDGCHERLGRLDDDRGSPLPTDYILKAGGKKEIWLEADDRGRNSSIGGRFMHWSVPAGSTGWMGRLSGLIDDRVYCLLDGAFDRAGQAGQVP
jgi:hypothetical protein